MNRKLLSLVLALTLILGLAAAFAESVGSYTYLDQSVMTMYVYTDNGKGLNVRSTPYVGDNIIGLAPYGSKLSVIRFLDNGWACIKWDKIGEAYVQSRFLQWFEPAPLVVVTPTPIPTAIPTIAPTARPNVLPAYTDTMAELNKEFRSARFVQHFVVSVRPARASGWVNMRWAPSKDAEVCATYRSGSLLTVIAETDSWYQVMDQNTQVTGFMMKSYTTRVY